MTLPYFCTFVSIQFPSCRICLYQVWLKLAMRSILKDYFQYTKFNVKIVSPLCPPTWPSGTIICTSLNLHYIRKRSCNSELLWLSGSHGEKIQWPCQIFAFLWSSPFWKGPGPLFEQFRIPFTQEWFVPNLIEIGLLVLEKIFFSIQTQMNNSESTLYQKAFM
jgi:hypothetical protein